MIEQSTAVNPPGKLAHATPSATTTASPSREAWITFFIDPPCAGHTGAVQ